MDFSTAARSMKEPFIALHVVVQEIGDGATLRAFGPWTVRHALLMADRLAAANPFYSYELLTVDEDCLGVVSWTAEGSRITEIRPELEPYVRPWRRGT